MALIEVKNLKKEFKKPVRKEGVIGYIKSLFSRKYTSLYAVNDVSFSIDQGEIVGYIGANGAGKSTTVKMMCGILHPTSGSVTINNKDILKYRKQINKEIGVVFGQKTQLWWDIPLIETFKILKSIYEITDEDYNERFKFLCDLLDLNDFLDQNVRSLSLGQRMRADLAAALIHNPKVIYLDEPTIGLDVVVKESVRKAIKEINKKYGTTIILTTHDLNDIEELCSRIIIIDKGKKIYDGEIEGVKEKYGYLTTVEIQVKENINLGKFNEFTDIKEDEEFNLSYKDNKLFITFNKNKISSTDIIGRTMKKLNVIDFSIKETSIEDIVKKMYRNEV